MADPKKEMTRGELWLEIEAFVAEQIEIVPPTDALKKMSPKGSPKDLVQAMMVVAYFDREYVGYIVESQRTIMIGENDVVIMQTVQNLMRLPVLTLQGSEDGQLNPRGRPIYGLDGWARKITMAILMGNYAQLLKTDNEEREAARVEFYKKQRAKNPHQPTSM